MRQRRKFEQTVPVGVVACQARHLQTEDDARPSHRHLRHEVLEAIAVLRCRARQAEVVVDGMYTLKRPAQRDCAIAQRILALRALGVLQHLAQAGLPHVQVGGTGQVRAGHRRRGLLAHRVLPLCGDGERHRGQQPDQLSVHAPGAGRPGPGGRGPGDRRRGRLAHLQPCGNPALLQHPQPQPPPVGVAGKRPGPQLLVPVHNVGSATARIVDIIARLHLEFSARARARSTDRGCTLIANLAAIASAAEADPGRDPAHAAGVRRR